MKMYRKSITLSITSDCNDIKYLLNFVILLNPRILTIFFSINVSRQNYEIKIIFF